MKFDCFYKVKITKGKKTKIERWGYYPYSMVRKDVKKLYKEGADAVELEMITEKQFTNIVFYSYKRSFSFKIPTTNRVRFKVNFYNKNIISDTTTYVNI